MELGQGEGWLSLQNTTEMTLATPNTVFSTMNAPGVTRSALHENPLGVSTITTPTFR